MSMEGLMHENGLRVEVDGDRLDIVLCQPQKRNAQSPAMWQSLAKIPDLLTDHIRFIVVRAEGVSFSAGLDRAMMTPEGIAGQGSFLDLVGYTTVELDGFIAQAQAGFRWFAEQPAISIAAVQGHAIGAGMQLALACDLIVASPDALFAMRETSLGLVPDLGGTAELVHRVGYSRALEICGTGRLVPAEEAAAIGLVTTAAPDGGLSAATDALVATLRAAPDGSLRALKPLLRQAIENDKDAQLQAERAAQIGRFADLAALMRST